MRKVLLPRPKSSKHSKPISALLFFARPEAELQTCTELILDFPGGGFISMGPDCHEERLRRWAKRTGKPVLSVDYGKAPECESGVNGYWGHADGHPYRSLPLGYRGRLRCVSHTDRDTRRAHRHEREKAGYHSLWGLGVSLGFERHSASTDSASQRRQCDYNDHASHLGVGGSHSASCRPRLGISRSRL